MKRKLLAMLLAVVLATGLLPGTAWAADTASGKCGDNVTWTYSDGVLTIDGTGPMYDYNVSTQMFSPRPWDDYVQKVDLNTLAYDNEIHTVIIGEGVTSIGSSAFDMCNNLTSVTIPNSVTSIGRQAFDYCGSLASITIPDSVTDIGDMAFYLCQSLTNVTIPNSVTSIGFAVFANCFNLTSIDIPSSVTSIGEQAFIDCISLTSLNIPASVTTIGDGAFYDCRSLTSVTIPSSVTSIGQQTFYSCDNLTSVTIPNSVTSIEQGAFGLCSSLTSVTIPNSVTFIGQAAFATCSSLTSVTIPNSVTSIGVGAFLGCESLTSVTIPDGVTNIEDMTFMRCDSLTSVTIPVSVSDISGGAFYECSSLTDVYYGGSEDQWNSISIDTSGNGNDPLLSAVIHFGNADEPVDTPDELIIVPEASETTYVIGSGGDITIYCTGDLSQFIRLLVDGQEISTENYLLEEGSTIVTLISAYLDTLSVGEHTVDLEFANGTAQTTITILERGSQEPSQGDKSDGEDSGTSDRPLDNSPQTSDNSMFTVWMALAVISLVGLAVTVLYSRKIRH